MILAAFAPINFTALILIIEREVSVLLKDANLAHALGTDPAGGDVGHATVFKTDTRVGDILARDSKPARRRHRLFATGERTRCKMISRSWIMRSSTTPISVLRFGIWRKAMRFDEARMSQPRFKRAQHRIEAFNMTDLQDEIFFAPPIRPVRVACAVFSAIGFSIRRCLPRPNKSHPTSKCALVVVATEAASTCSPKSSREAAARTPKLPAIFCARARSKSSTS